MAPDWGLARQSEYTARATTGGIDDVSLLERRFRAWGARWGASDTNNNVIGRLGLSLLHLAAEPLVDLIFVHGLRGGSIKTWRKGNSEKTLWPQHWLPLEPAFRNVSVHTFGYNADWGETKHSFLNVHDFGRALLEEMRTSPHIRNGGGNPIVLISHSMGGLVAKKAYILARQDVASHDLAQRIRSMFFLATPHRGSDFAQLLNNILGASGAFSSRQYITDLERNSTSAQMINDEFRHYGHELILYSFYETMKTSLGLSSAIIVDRGSAVLGYQNERAQYLNANHRDICKYSDPLDPNYITLRNALQTVVGELSSGSSALKGEKARAQMRTIQGFLDIYEKPEEECGVGIRGTCEWIQTRNDFEDWCNVLKEPSGNNIDHDLRCYWVNGKPGAGKSVLAGHVVTYLESLGLDCSYYFFNYGKKSSQKLSDLLRSLAFQMAQSNAIIRQRVVELAEDEVKFDKDDERAIWRRVFVNCILKTGIHRPHYWVIDALDECVNYSALFQFISKLELKFPLRIFITSRKHPEIHKQYKRLGEKAVEATISLADTYHDIELFLASRIDDLPVDDGTVRQDLISKILAKSAGCFLWVRLVLQELEHIYDELNFETVLDEMPQEMGGFYGRTVELMSKTLRDKHIAKAIIRWSIASVRPLKVAELQQALKIDIGVNISSIEKSVAGLCGQLVVVDKNGAVQMVHQTARDFLLAVSDSDFGVDPETEHGRLALACLQFLCSDEMRPPRNWKFSTHTSSTSAFCDYACTSFSDHVLAASPVESDIPEMLWGFLRTNVLTWIEQISRKGSLYHLTRTAKNLRAYLEKRARCSSPLEPLEAIEAWAIDLIRIVAKFGTAIISDPTSIYFLIPPLCPTGSAIYKGSVRPANGLVLSGLTNATWEDCVSCIDFDPSSRATALACGANVFAVGMRSGSITLYNQGTLEIERNFDHPEPIKLLKFDESCRRFISSGYKTIKFWDRQDGDIWSQSLASPCMAIAIEANHIVGITKTSHIIIWDITNGEVKANSLYPYHESDNVGGYQAFHKAPLAAAFSPNLEILALGYRSQFVCLWDLNTQDFLGCCSRPAGVLTVGTVLFNPNPDKSLLAVSYQDGDLAIFNPQCQEMVKVYEGAHVSSLASTPDGRTLAAGDYCGTVQLWDFETLTLIYRIKSYDFEVKALAFSGDGLRLVDIRDSRSKIWELTALVRTTTKTDVSMDKSSVIPAVTVGYEYFNEILDITAITAHPNLPVIFAGKSDGCVAVYDSITGSEKMKLYSHSKDAFVTTITCNKNNIVASADAGGAVQVWHLMQVNGGSWKAQSQVLAIPPEEAIKQLMFSANGAYLLISAVTSAAVWSISGGELTGSRKFGHGTRTVWKWFLIPGLESEFFLIVDSEIERYSWSTFSEASVTSYFTLFYNEELRSDKIEIQNALLDARSNRLIVDFRKHYGNKSTATLLVFDYLSSSPSGEIQPDSHYAALGDRVKYFIGVDNSQLIFIDRDCWLSSADLISYDGKEYIRHFWVPYDVVAGNTGVMAVLTAVGDIAFAKQGELGIVRNGKKFRRVTNII